MSWVAPITDRTADDVAYARQHRSSATDNKGALNASDLNRIEGDCRYLADQIAAYGYSISITTKTDYAMSGWPAQAQLNRIRDNIEALQAAYYTLAGSPTMDFTTSIDWQDVNDIEQNLQNLKILIERMVEGFRRCGSFSFYSGTAVVLPA